MAGMLRQLMSQLLAAVSVFDVCNSDSVALHAITSIAPHYRCRGQ